MAVVVVAEGVVVAPGVVVTGAAVVVVVDDVVVSVMPQVDSTKVRHIQRSVYAETCQMQLRIRIDII